LELLFGPAQGGAVSMATLSDQATRNLGRALEDLPAVARDAAVKEVRAATARLLDMNLIDLLITGWRQYHDLTSAARRTLTVPGRPELVSLVTHRVTVTQQPHVDVLVNGRLVATVRLSVSVVFDVSGLLVGISAGRLIAVHAGRCDITVTLAVDDIDVATRQARLELPGVIPVTPGIRLLAAKDYPVGEPPRQWRWWEAGGVPSPPAGPAVARPARAAITQHRSRRSRKWWER
jgi:hypothetical protein